MAGGLFNSQTEWGVVFVLLFGMVAATEVGFRLGRRRRDREGEAAGSHSVTIQAALLGLLGLLLGFTFSMAVNRYDQRKEMAVQEANAVGTAGLRVRLLPAADRAEALTLLRQYTDARLEMVAPSTDPARAEANGRKAAELQGQLWSRAAAVAEKDPRAVTTGMYLQSLNDLFDAATRREAAVRNHVPLMVLVLVFAAAVLSAGFVGYTGGLSGTRDAWATMAKSVVIALTVMVIVDLDRPGQGLIRVSQACLKEARAALDQMPP